MNIHTDVYIHYELEVWSINDFYVDVATKRVEILELEDIEKEYILVDARLELLKQDKSNSVGSG